MKIIRIAFFLAAVSTTAAFLPLQQLPKTRITIGEMLLQAVKDDKLNQEARIPFGKKERYVRLTPDQVIAHLTQEYQELQEQLRHDLFQLKHLQHEVAEEEDALLQETMQEIEMEWFAQELDVIASEEDYQSAHRDFLHAKMKKKIALQKWAQDQAAWMDSQLNDLQLLLSLGTSSEELKKSCEALEASQEAERQALVKETRAEGLLKFLEEREAALREISLDLQKEQLWVQQELANSNHHQSTLQVAALERETENLWNHLRQDLLDLKRQQLRVDQEEKWLATKEAKIVDMQIQQEEEQVQDALAEMKKAHEQVKQAAARKEQAYKDTLAAIKIGKEDPRELWMLSQVAQEKNKSFEAADVVKERLTGLAAKEAQAEDLLMLLERKAAVLKELRLPGQEEALQKWVKDELSHHETMLDFVKDTLIDSCQ